MDCCFGFQIFEGFSLFVKKCYFHFFASLLQFYLILWEIIQITPDFEMSKNLKKWKILKLSGMGSYAAGRRVIPSRGEGEGEAYVCLKSETLQRKARNIWEHLKNKTYWISKFQSNLHSKLPSVRIELVTSRSLV